MSGYWPFSFGFALPMSTVENCALRFLSLFPVSATERLVIMMFGALSPTRIDEFLVYSTFLLMNDLRTLMLIHCVNCPFILVLNPKRNSSGTVVCPKLEELVLYMENKDWFCIDLLLEMARGRASSGSKLPTTTIVGSQESVPAKEVLRLRDHVSRMEYRLDDIVLEWDGQHGADNNSGYDSD